MKIQFSKPILTFAATAVLLFNSCKPTEEEPVVVKSYGKIQVFHAAVDAPAINFEVDGKKMNTDSLSYPKGTPYFDAELTAGKKNVYKIVAAKSSQNLSIDSLTMNTTDVGYSVFVYQDKDAAKTIRSIYSPDNLLAPPAGKAKVRLVFLIPDFNVNVDVQVVTSGGEATSSSDFPNVSFPKMTDFINLPKGTYDLKVKFAGQTTSRLTFTNVAIEDGKIYTLVARGLFNVAPTLTNNRGPALSIVTNK